MGHALGQADSAINSAGTFSIVFKLKGCQDLTVQPFGIAIEGTKGLGGIFRELENRDAVS